MVAYQLEGKGWIPLGEVDHLGEVPKAVITPSCQSHYPSYSGVPFSILSMRFSFQKKKKSTPEIQYSAIWQHSGVEWEAYHSFPLAHLQPQKQQLNEFKIIQWERNRHHGS